MATAVKTDEVSQQWIVDVSAKSPAWADVRLMAPEAMRMKIMMTIVNILHVPTVATMKMRMTIMDRAVAGSAIRADMLKQQKEDGSIAKTEAHTHAITAITMIMIAIIILLVHAGITMVLLTTAASPMNVTTATEAGSVIHADMRRQRKRAGITEAEEIIKLSNAQNPKAGY